MYPFPDALRPALQRLIEKAQSDYVASTSAEDWPLCAPESELADAEIVRQSLATLGWEVDIKTAFSVWEYCSLDIGASWADGPGDVNDACVAIANLCENISQGQDYAGFTTINQ